MLFSDSSQKRMLSACLWVAGALVLMTVAFMGAEYDEAWIVASSRQAFNPDALPAVFPVTTTGGVHFFLVGLSQSLPLSPLVVPRLISALSMLALFWILLRALRPLVSDGVEQRIILVTCLAAPGTMLLSGMGYGVPLAMLLLMAGILLATGSDRISPGPAVLAGLFIGAAIATRWTLIPTLPALLVCAFYSRDHLRHNLVMTGLAGAITIGVFAAFFMGQMHLLDGTGPAARGVSVTTNLTSTGVGFGLPYPPRSLSFLVRFVTTLPLAFLILAPIAYLAWTQEDRAKRLLLVLLGASALIVLAWILRSPWMHLRYIWPVYLMLSVVAGLALVAFYRMAKATERPELVLLAVGLPVVLFGAQAIVAFRVIAIGAAMQLNSAGNENLENHFRPFHHIREERAVVDLLQSLDPDAVVGTIFLPEENGAQELALLSDRHVFDFGVRLNAGVFERPDYFITHRFSPFNETGRAWVDALGPPVDTALGFTLYEVPEDVQIPEVLDVVLDPQLYRFTGEKWVSLTWF